MSYLTLRSKNCIIIITIAVIFYCTKTKKRNSIRFVKHSSKVDLIITKINAINVTKCDRNIASYLWWLSDLFREWNFFYCSEILLINYKERAVNEFEQNFYKNFRSWYPLKTNISIKWFLIAFLNLNNRNLIMNS